jgi:hypothetical protein
VSRSNRTRKEFSSSRVVMISVVSRTTSSEIGDVRAWFPVRQPHSWNQCGYPLVNPQISPSAFPAIDSQASSDRLADGHGRIRMVQWPDIREVDQALGIGSRLNGQPRQDQAALVVCGTANARGNNRSWSIGSINTLLPGRPCIYRSSCGHQSSFRRVDGVSPSLPSRGTVRKRGGLGRILPVRASASLPGPPGSAPVV